MTRSRYTQPSTATVVTAIVHINGKRFLFFKWPEGEWIAHVDMMVRDDEGVSTFDRPAGGA